MLVAAKHLSMLDTIIPFLVFPDVAIVLKTELLAWPVFGWYCQRAGMIPVDRRRAGQRAAPHAARSARAIGKRPRGFHLS
ncbi:MAG: 1-acyl-sn-glycerol-3-phosphate acyltransferase [Alphaproteobacteria bacterium]